MGSIPVARIFFSAVLIQLSERDEASPLPIANEGERQPTSQPTRDLQTSVLLTLNSLRHDCQAAQIGLEAFFVESRSAHEHSWSVERETHVRASTGLPMKGIVAVGIMGLALSFFGTSGSAHAGANSDDPCENETSNVDMRECYTHEQPRVNAEAESFAKRIEAEFRKEAQDPVMSPTVADMLRKASSSVTRSQKNWKLYRDQHCLAVKLSFTTGSGAGTAYEKCLFELGQERLRELRSAFGKPARNYE